MVVELVHDVCEGEYGGPAIGFRDLAGGRTSREQPAQETR